MIQRRSLSICLLVALQLLHGSVAAQQVESLAGSTETPEFNEPIDLQTVQQLQHRLQEPMQDAPQLAGAWWQA